MVRLLFHKEFIYSNFGLKMKLTEWNEQICVISNHCLFYWYFNNVFNRLLCQLLNLRKTLTYVIRHGIKI